MFGSGRAFAIALALVCLSRGAQASTDSSSSIVTSTTSTTSVVPRVDDRPEASSYAVRVTGRRARSSASDLRFEFEPSFAAGAGQTGADLLARAPGVVITQHSGEGKAHQVFLRGFDAVHGRDVEIHVGGIPINEPSNLHGQGYADLHFLIAEGVRRLHVLEGPFAARQGDFAIAGSFDFDLGLAQRGVLARTSAGSFGATRALVAWGPESLTESSFVAAEVARSDGFGPNRAHQRASAITQIEWPLANGLVLRTLASAYDGRFDSAGVLRLDDYEAGRVSFFDAAFEHQGGESSRQQALIELRSESNEHDAVLSTYVVARDLLLRQNFTGHLLSPEFGDLNEQANQTLTIGGRATYRRSELLGTFDVDLGVIWRHDRSTQRQLRLRRQDQSAYRTEVDADLALTGVGLYGETSVDLGEAWTLRAGLRADTIVFAIEDRLRALRSGVDGGRDTLGFRAAPRVGVSWQPNDRLALFLAYGQGFRSPSALSLSDDEKPTFTIVHAGELGAHWTPWSALDTTLAFFSTYVDEDLQFDHASATTVISGATVRAGATLLAALRPFDGARAELAATYTYNRNLDLGTPVPFTPAFVARGELEFSRSLAELRGSELTFFGRTELSVVAEKSLPYSETALPYLLTELSLGLGLGAVSVSVELYNLFDARWRDGEFVYASSFDPNAATRLVPARHFTAGRPFTAQLSLSLEIE